MYVDELIVICGWHEFGGFIYADPNSLIPISFNHILSMQCTVTSLTCLCMDGLLGPRSSLIRVYLWQLSWYSFTSNFWSCHVYRLFHWRFTWQGRTKTFWAATASKFWKKLRHMIMIPGKYLVWHPCTLLRCCSSWDDDDLFVILSDAFLLC